MLASLIFFIDLLFLGKKSYGDEEKSWRIGNEHKGNNNNNDDDENCHPLTCLPTNYKILDSVIIKRVYEYLDEKHHDSYP